jgi:hypothetical protein
MPESAAFVHVLPTGHPKRFIDVSQYRYSSTIGVAERIERSYIASVEYWEALTS